MLTKLLRSLFGMSQLGVLKWDIKRQPAVEDYGVLSDACHKFLLIRIL